MSRPRPKPMKRFKQPAALLLPSEQETFGQAKAAGSAYRSMPGGGIMIVAEDEMVEFSENSAAVFAKWRGEHPASVDGMFAVDRLPRLTPADVPGDGPREALAAMLAYPGPLAIVQQEGETEAEFRLRAGPLEYVPMSAGYGPTPTDDDISKARDRRDLIADINHALQVVQECSTPEPGAEEDEED